jgi:hypothetical protein
MIIIDTILTVFWSVMMVLTWILIFKNKQLLERIKKLQSEIDIKNAVQEFSPHKS